MQLEIISISSLVPDTWKTAIVFIKSSISKDLIIKNKAFGVVLPDKLEKID